MGAGSITGSTKMKIVRIKYWTDLPDDFKGLAIKESGNYPNDADKLYRYYTGSYHFIDLGESYYNSMVRQVLYSSGDSEYAPTAYYRAKTAREHWKTIYSSVKDSVHKDLIEYLLSQILCGDL